MCAIEKDRTRVTEKKKEGESLHKCVYSRRQYIADGRPECEYSEREGRRK